MKKLLIGILSLAICFGVTACGSTAKPVQNEKSSSAKSEQIKGSISHSSSPNSTYDVGAHYFADLVKKYTNNSVVIEVFPSAQLGSDKEALEGQRTGTVDFSLPGTSMLSQYKPNVAVFNLPFLFKNRKDAYSVLDSDTAANIYSSTEEIGIKVLATFESGFRQVASSKKAIKSINDLKGQKIRVPDGDLYVKTWKALGVNPTVLAWNEVFSALQTGIVDGEEAPISSFDSAGFSEVVKNFSYINYMYDPVALTVSVSFWKKLNPEQQAAVQKAAKEASAYERNYNEKLEKELQGKLEKKGVIFQSPDLKEFQDAVKPIYSEYKDQKTLKSVLSIMGR